MTFKGLKGVFYDHAPRWCSSCLTQQPVAGGEFEKIANNRQRWVCGGCKKRREDAKLDGSV